MNTKVLTKLDRKEMEIKYDQFLNLNLNAIKIIKKHQEILKKDKFYDILFKRLELGLSIIEAGYKRYKTIGVDGLIAELETYYRSPIGKEMPIKGRGKKYRPGIGLSRGFGEFIYADEAMEDEIMDSVYKIEDYYRTM